MKKTLSFWKNTLFWGLVIIAVYAVSSFTTEPYSGTCMFILIPYFMSLVSVMPVARLRRFGAMTVAYIPYAVIGFFPLYFFEWLEAKSLVGLWAAFAFCVPGLLIGLGADLAFLATKRLHDGIRAIAAGAAVQIVTFFTMLLGFTFLYVNPDSIAHLHFFNREWYFTLPWLALNGGFGGYTAYAITRLARLKQDCWQVERKRSRFNRRSRRLTPMKRKKVLNRR
jgi:hypothetical protein